MSTPTALNRDHSDRRRSPTLLPRTVAACVVTACAAATLAATATAAPASVARFADRESARTTDDGWRVTATKAAETVRSIPPLNGSPWTREGFVSLKAIGAITGTGRAPINAATVAGGFQLACNTDVTTGATVGIAGGPNATLNVTYPPALGIGANLQPNISTTLKPGTITDIPLGTKRLAGPKAAFTVTDVHLKTDGCLGPVTLRAYVTVAISTPGNDDTINVYGKPHHL